MAWSTYILGDRPRRFANNKLGWNNQWRSLSCAFYHSNEPVCPGAHHLHTILSHSRERRISILTEFDIIKANQGNIVRNTQTVFRERTKNTHSHQIAPGNDGGKVVPFGKKYPGCLIGLINIPTRLAHQARVRRNACIRKRLLAA